jgi:hypothetical protein
MNNTSSGALLRPQKSIYQTRTSPNLSAEYIADSLGGKRKSSNGFTCLCPAHNDKSPSLHIAEKEGKILFHCFAGCNQEAVVNALEVRNLWKHSKKAALNVKREIVSTYQYTDEYGKLIIEKVRYRPKDFRLRHVGKNGEWVWNANGCRQVPYQLPKLMSSILNGETILIVEGEKDVLKAEMLGLTATCNRDGADKFPLEIVQYFEGASVVVVPDNDEPGAKHAIKIVSSLIGVAKSVDVLELPDLPEKGDLSDWLNAGGTKDKFLNLVKESSISGEEYLKAKAECEYQVQIESETDSHFEWEALEKIPNPLPVAPSLSIEDAKLMIPDGLGDWIIDASTRLQVPIETLAVVAISTASALIGKKLAICPKQFDSWSVYPNLWCAVIARAGKKKSPTIDEAMRALDIFEAEERQLFEDALFKQRAALTVYEVKMAATKDELKAEAKKTGSPKMMALQQNLEKLERESQEVKVFRKRFKTSDPSVEKLAELMNENPNGLVLKRDEISGWLKSFERNGHEADRAFYLECWSGKGSFQSDRISRGTIDVQSMMLTVIGGIQPGKLMEYVVEANRGGGGDDGLLQRFQLSVFPENIKSVSYIDQKPDAAAWAKAFSIFSKLRKLSPNDFPINMERLGVVPCIRFSKEAQALYKEWSLALEHRLNADDELSPVFESHLAKYRSLLPGLALLFQVISWAESGVELNEVGLESARRAAMWCDFLEAHAKKIYAIAINSPVFSAEALSKKIKSGKITDQMKLRDIYRHHWSGLDDKKQVEEAISILEPLNWIRTEKVETDGRDQVVIRLHPDLRKEEQ